MLHSRSIVSAVGGNRYVLLHVVGALVVAVTGFWSRPAGFAHAQGPSCFDVPDITACVEGRFLEFWDSNGGLSTFGYPLGPARQEQTSDGLFLVQYFERARFELHPDMAPPYDVMLGRLGFERLAQLGMNAPAAQSEAVQADCLFWVETKHNVCGPFRDMWLSHGVDLHTPPDTSTAGQLALWGLPLTGVVSVSSDDGVVMTQWFERARFEQQPDGSMTIGLLGRELLDAAAASAPAAAEPVAPTEGDPIVPAAQAPPVARVPNVPTPQLPCNSNVPTPAEGIQIWMADPRPAPGQDAVACVRLIVDGDAVRGANAITYRYRGGERRASIPQSTGGDGVASFIFYTGADAAGERVVVEAVASYRGVVYSAFGEYTRQ